MKLELVSFKLCPFVQRAVIALKEKKVDYDITYIDLSSPPEWFLEISPLGQVPLLKVGNEVLFESAAITEFIDDISEGSLHPEDPLVRAKNRGWIEFASSCLEVLFTLNTSADEEAFKQAVETMRSRMRKLEITLEHTPWFNGDKFSLVDAAFAPLFMRLDLLKELTGTTTCEDLPKVCSWRDRLLQQDSVISSVVEEFPTIYRGMLKMKDGVAGGRLS
ncbi:MAG: glutathione S-transferase family protein [Thiotrichales bacterium]|nr:glutathione S-transferase family protein [Thiotrichales bacterium]MBT3613717.1 glutathione S-transferase family protein [Thiotrichales bacterium]MBT3753097.1 glutathione S-transferase family protein [Thiotrichales bacterium]MBT3838277.1 glutathione S-transferase family protein [Thiotrichales bacterium]MBT4151688.1 glutathione S-transferase family protein [Thiotrichales bacterium]